VLRYAEEKSKPNDQRLREYQDAGLASFEQRTYSSAPLNNALEELVLASNSVFSKELRGDDPFVHAILGGQSPEHAAHHYFFSTTKIQDVEERKRLAHISTR